MEMLILSALLCFFLLIQESYAAKILVIPAHNLASHTKSMYPFAELLAAQNNEVYMLQILEGEHEKTKGKKVKDIYLMLPPSENAAVEGPLLWTMKVTQPIGMVFPWHATTQPCKKVLHNPQLYEEFMKIIKQKWDVLIVDSYFTACGILATHFNDAPWIDFSTSFVLPNTADILGSQWRPSYTPAFRPHGKFDPTNFWERVWNTHDIFIVETIFSSLQFLLPLWIDHPLAANMSAYRYFSQSALAYGSMPYEINFSHAKVPNIIEIDLVCPKPSQLPDNYAAFVEDPASKGTILFAMGHFGDWQYAPAHALQSFVDAFNELTDYRIIWQYVSKGEKPKVGKHVMLDPWIPQVGILYHNKTSLFISHVGFKSVRESICAKVPVVALPMFAEQFRNTAFAKQRGYGVFLDKMNLSKANVLNALKTVLNDRSYKKNVAKMASYSTDRIVDQVKLGSFWLDFVLKHKSYALTHLRPKVPATFLCEYSSIISIIAICSIFTSILV